MQFSEKEKCLYNELEGDVHLVTCRATDAWDVMEHHQSVTDSRGLKTRCAFVSGMMAPLNTTLLGRSFTPAG